MDDDNPFNNQDPFGFMNNMGGMFDLEVDDELDEGTEVAVRVTKAADAIHELADYIEENDIDMREMDREDVVALSPGEHSVIMSTATLGQALDHFADATDSDDDDDNPFKVSDGDDPIY